MKKYILGLLALCAVWACSTQEIETFTGDRYLYFPGHSTGLDTANFTFFHYPGETFRELPFTIALTGELLDTPLEYRLIVVDSLTTADPKDYVLPTGLTFGADRETDELKIRINNVRPELQNKAFTVVFRIEANDHFGNGLIEFQQIRITFSDQRFKPLWWAGDVERILLGAYSESKYEHFILATGEGDLAEKSLAEVRSLALRFKQYLVENNVMEDDGVTPMVDGVPAR